MRWEYSFQYVYTMHSIEELNNLGKEGWEIIHVFEQRTIYQNKPKYKVICKRLIK